jgi:hypothetical protein
MKLLATAATLCLAVLYGGQALATPTITQRDKDIHIDLIELVAAIGVDIQYEGLPCQLDWHGAYKLDGSELVLCANKDVSQAEKLDTIRHEAWHVYQDLKDCKLSDVTSLQPVFSTGVVEPDYIAVASKQYLPNQVVTEAEAAWAASTFDAEQINILMFNKAKSCGYKL